MRKRSLVRRLVIYNWFLTLNLLERRTSHYHLAILHRQRSIPETRKESLTKKSPLGDFLLLLIPELIPSLHFEIDRNQPRRYVILSTHLAKQQS